MNRTIAAATAAVVIASHAAAGARETPLIPPVDAPVARGFDAPLHAFAHGHRGVDHAVPVGTAIRAAAAGSVGFAGLVGGRLAVTIDHGGGLATTYSWLSDVFVSPGETVDVGRWIGRSGEAHPGAPGLHFGVKLDEAYVDPAAYLGPPDVARALHLAPLDAAERCRAAAALGARPPPPNDNVAVAIAGIASKTAGGVEAAILEHGPELLGYPRRLVYAFSYRGPAGPRLHEPYARTDTYRDVGRAARALVRLLRRIRARHPGREVDLIAHSEGGIVARVFLARLARAWDPRLPPVEHLVTFATPHRGAPLAGAVDDLARTFAGGAALPAISLWARRGGALPDPYAPVVAQMAPGSALLRWLAREDVAFGTRALSLVMANDLVVPPPAADLEGHTTRILAPEAADAHSAVVASPAARAIAHAFLRDAPPPCRTAWDVWGPRVGGVVAFLEHNAGEVYGFVEDRVVGPLARAARLVLRYGGRAVRWAPGAVRALGRLVWSAAGGRR